MAFQIEKIKKKTPSSEINNDFSSILQKDIQLFGSSFSNKVKEDFYVELSVLLKAGVSLKVALELLEDTQKKKQNKIILQKITNNIISGKSFSAAVKKEKPFSDYEYYSIRIGEESATLANVIEQLGQFFSEKNEQRRQLVGALTYPIIILGTAFLVVLFMLQFVVPMFEGIFKQHQVELPAITKIIISASEFIKYYGWMLIVTLIIFIGIRILLNKNKKYLKFKDQFVMKLPVIGKFIQILYLSRFTQALALLISAKIPMVQSISLVREMITFYPLQHALEMVEKDLLKGSSLSESLSKHNMFKAKMVTLIKVAEETNQNDFIFKRLSEQYKAELQQQSKFLSTVMEPFIILIVGVLVGVILVAMYLPMFRLSSVLG